MCLLLAGLILLIYGVLLLSALVEAFPPHMYENICAGTDCPPSWITRLRRARTDVDGRTMELVVGWTQSFLLVHP